MDTVDKTNLRPEQLTNDSPRATVIRSIKQWINEGVLTQGLALPPEREIAKRLGVARSAVQRAIAVLEDEGVVRSHDGRTRTVCERPPVESSGSLMRSVLAVVAGSRQPMHEHKRPGWAEFVALGAFEAAQDRGLHALAFHPQRLLGDDVDRLIQDRPLGVVVPEIDRVAPSKALLDRIRRSRIALVVYGDGAELAEFDRVYSDHETGAYELTRWLIARERRRIIIMLPLDTELYWVRARLAGYERAMREAGLKPRPPVAHDRVSASGDPARQFAVLRDYMVGSLLPHILTDEPADAILLPSDGHVCTASAALRLLGKQAGSDVLLAGYDNYWQEPWEQQFEPARPCVTMDKRNLEMGQELVRLLLDRVEGRLPPEPQSRVVRPELVIPGP